MKKLLYIIIAISFVLQSNEVLASTFSLLYEFEQLLKGGFKEAKLYLTKYKDNDSSKILCNIYVHDSDGEPIECYRYNGNESFFEKNTKKYENGKLVERVEYSSQGKIYEMYCYDYNDLGYDSYSMWISGDVGYQLIYFHDDKGRNIIGERYHSEGYLLSVINNYFDENDRLIETIEHNIEDGTFFNHKIFSYDEKGNVINELSGEYNRNYELSSFVYDERGNIIRDEYFRGADSIPIYSFEKYTKYGSTDIHYTYDTLGNQIEIKYIRNTNDSVKVEFKYDFKYDEYGNIIERKDYKDNILTSKFEIVLSKKIQVIE